MMRKRALFGAYLLVFTTTQTLAGSGDEAGIASPEAEDISLAEHQEVESVARYRTREEARESGLERELTDWLTLYTLFEAEVVHSRETYSDGSGNKLNEESLTFQLGMSIDLSEVTSIELVTEYDSDEAKFLTEEALLVLEFEPWELAIGKQYTPLGSYFSRFVTGPMVEFGETQADKSVAVIYGPRDELDITLMLYQGLAVEQDANEDEWNWSLGLEVWPSDSFSIGLSYQSDIADSDEELLDDWENRYSDPVAGASAYMFLIRGQYEFSLEYLTALSSFKELGADRDKPFAWNGEISHYFDSSDMEIALRLEASRELMGMPTQRYGIAMTKYVTARTYFTIEYLRERFGRHALFEEEDETLDHNDLFAAKLTIEL